MTTVRPSKRWRDCVCGCVYLIRPDGLLAVICYLLGRGASLWRRPESRTPEVYYGLNYCVLLAIPLPLIYAGYCMVKTGHPLPTPYSSKIVHHVPGALSDTLFGRMHRAWSELAPAAKEFYYMAAGSASASGDWLAGARVWNALTAGDSGQDRHMYSELAAISYVVGLPLLFAFFFPTNQGFGGWYLRYLQPAYPLFVLIGVLGLFTIANHLPSWMRWLFALKRPIPAIAFHIVLGVTLLVGGVNQLRNTYYAYHLLSDVKNAYRFAVRGLDR